MFIYWPFAWTYCISLTSVSYTALITCGCACLESVKKKIQKNKKKHENNLAERAILMRHNNNQFEKWNWSSNYTFTRMPWEKARTEVTLWSIQLCDECVVLSLSLLSLKRSHVNSIQAFEDITSVMSLENPALCRSPIVNWSLHRTKVVSHSSEKILKSFVLNISLALIFNLISRTTCLSCVLGCKLPKRDFFLFIIILFFVAVVVVGGK